MTLVPSIVKSTRLPAKCSPRTSTRFHKGVGSGEMRSVFRVGSASRPRIEDTQVNIAAADHSCGVQVFQYSLGGAPGWRTSPQKSSGGRRVSPTT